jgi:hypothetical protein
MAVDIRLRYRDKAKNSLLWRSAASLVLCPLGAGLYAIGHHQGDFLVGAYIGLGCWAVLWAFMLPQFYTRYRIRGDSLVSSGLGTNKVDLASAWRACFEVPHKGRKGQLVLVLDIMRIKLGDTSIGCYYRPDGLHVLADALAKSSNPDIRATAQSLRAVADQPDASPWPIQPESIRDPATD